MQWYDAILAATEANKLMVEFHGCTIPRGLQRTWPQVLTMEAVRGAEAIHNKPGRNPFPPAYYTTLPFTRNLAGSMDYTPLTFTAKRTNSDAARSSRANPAHSSGPRFRCFRKIRQRYAGETCAALARRKKTRQPASIRVRTRYGRAMAHRAAVRRSVTARHPPPDHHAASALPAMTCHDRAAWVG